MVHFKVINEWKSGKFIDEKEPKVWQVFASKKAVLQQRDFLDRKMGMNLHLKMVTISEKFCVSIDG